jgi:hypothetical protein
MLPRSLLNLIFFFGLWAIIWLPIFLVLTKFIDWQSDRSVNFQQKLILVISLYSLVPWIVWLEIRLKGLSFGDLGLIWDSSLFISLGWGFLLSIATSLSIFSFESRCGLLTWNWHNRQRLLPLIVPILVLALGISAIEELVFRGYVINILTLDYPYWLAAIISSAIFAALHLIWERRETIPQIPGLWLMGIILVMARWLDNDSLGLAIGMHSGWIWLLSCLDSAELIKYDRNDRQWITGINRQPLAGVAGISCLLLAGLCLWVLSVN